MSDFEDCMNMAFYVANFRKRIRFVAATDLATHTKESFTVYNVLPINSIKMETKTKIVPFNEKGYLNALKLITRAGYPCTISSIQEIDTPIGPKRCVISRIEVPFSYNGQSFKEVNIIHEVHFACDGKCVELFSSSYDLLMEIKDDPMEKIRAVIKNYQFKPFDPIILRTYKFTTNGIVYEWKLGLFSKIEKRIITVDGIIEKITFLSIEGFSGDECVPYNEETKFLVGTSLSLKS